MSEVKTKKGAGCLGCTMVGIPVGIILIILLITAWMSYNGMVSKEEVVNSQWAQVENTYQRRADLIGNLVETVKGYASHERGTLTDVIEARAKATSVNIDPTSITDDNIKQFEQVQKSLSSAFSKLMVVVERYPDLKANQNFLSLQGQLEQIENTILVERRKFNEQARVYNTYIRKFPKNLFAGMFDFEPKAYFKAKEGADEVPKVKF